MRRLAIITGVITCLLAPLALAGLNTGSAAEHRAPVLLAFRGGGFHLGGGGFGRRGIGSGGLFGRRRSGFFGRHGFLRRAARLAFFAYVLHLFFSNGGLSLLLWLVIIGLVVHFVRRRRQRSPRYSY